MFTTLSCKYANMPHGSKNFVHVQVTMKNNTGVHCY